jgi:hypothetical protein
MWLLESDGDIFHGRGSAFQGSRELTWAREEALASPRKKVHLWSNGSRQYGLLPIGSEAWQLADIFIGGGFVIENKTISRKHLVVEVGQIKPGDGVCAMVF